MKNCWFFKENLGSVNPELTLWQQKQVIGVLWKHCLMRLCGVIEMNLPLKQGGLSAEATQFFIPLTTRIENSIIFEAYERPQL
jgi:hypothetical protein